MTQQTKVQYTAKAHNTGGRNGPSSAGNTPELELLAAEIRSAFRSPQLGAK
jgi:hypothetical protein